MIPPPVFLFFETILAILVPLPLCVNLNHLVYIYKKCCWHFLLVVVSRHPHLVAEDILTVSAFFTFMNKPAINIKRFSMHQN